MLKQSSSFSSPREIKGSSSAEVLEEELATDVSDLVARSCCMTLKYSSSVLAQAKGFVFLGKESLLGFGFFDGRGQKAF